MLKIQARVAYDTEDLAQCKELSARMSPTDPDTLLLRASLLYKESKFAEAERGFAEVQKMAGWSPRLGYNLALCAYKLRAFTQAAKGVAEVIERGVREHPEFATAGAEGPTRSVGNSQALRDSFLVEAFNLKAAIEYSLKKGTTQSIALKLCSRSSETDHG